MSDLDELASRVRIELESVAYPARDWVVPRHHDGEKVLDVLIVGGGQNGITLAFQLMRDCVTNIAILDKSPPGLAGPWSTFARMKTLRSPKHVFGPELGLPSLSVRSWYEAVNGPGSWAAVTRVSTPDWHAYIRWLQQVLAIPVTSEAEVFDIEPLEGDVFAVHAMVGGERRRYLARHVVLSTGIEGAGRWDVPAMIADALPKSRYAHSSEAIDFEALAGKRIAVLGAGASAFDNAATALERGAGHVAVYARRRQLPKVNPNRYIEFTGYVRHFADLDDSVKWRFMSRFYAMNQPPPQDTFERCARFENFDVHLGSPLNAVMADGETIVIDTPAGRERFDFLIIGTGFRVDLALRPELARFADRIALWSDRFTPPAGSENGVLSRYPYLTGNFQFTEKEPGSAPFLDRIYCNSFGANLSLGATAGIAQLGASIERIAFGITKQLFRDDSEAFIRGLETYSQIDFDMSAFEARRAAREAVGEEKVA